MASVVQQAFAKEREVRGAVLIEGDELAAERAVHRERREFGNKLRHVAASVIAVMISGVVCHGSKLTGMP
jgi:hypothetical protein